MPLRRRDHKPSKNVTLHETLNWIAFGNFGGPSLYFQEVAAQILGIVDDVEQIEIAEFSRQQSLEVAEEDLFAALRDGDIEARGRFGDHNFNNWRASEWTEQIYDDHSETRSEIPAEYWRREGVDWNANRVKSPNGEYTDIILGREEVLALWPLETLQERDALAPSGEDDPAKRRGKKRGRKERYPEKEFFALCVWDAAANDVPGTQAEMVDRMARLLAVVWGEDNVPGETWLKEKIGQIFKHREKYEDGRQLLEGNSITDQAKIGS